MPGVPEAICPRFSSIWSFAKAKIITRFCESDEDFCIALISSLKRQLIYNYFRSLSSNSHDSNLSFLCEAFNFRHTRVTAYRWMAAGKCFQRNDREPLVDDSVNRFEIMSMLSTDGLWRRRIKETVTQMVSRNGWTLSPALNNHSIKQNYFTHFINVALFLLKVSCDTSA